MKTPMDVPPNIDVPPSIVPIVVIILVLFYAGLFLRWWIEKPSNLPLLKQCVLGLFLGAGPAFLVVASSLAATFQRFRDSADVDASIPLLGVILLIVEQGYIWDDAQKHLRERLLKATPQDR